MTAIIITWSILSALVSAYLILSYLEFKNEVTLFDVFRMFIETLILGVLLMPIMAIIVIITESKYIVIWQRKPEVTETKSKPKRRSK